MAGSIGDMVFDLMGQPDPRRQLAAQLSGGIGMGAPAPAANGGQAGGGLANMAQGGMGPDQQAPPQPQPQPAAYTSPPDLAHMYLGLLQRQQSTEAINRGAGLLFGAFAAPQDRGPMLQAMTGQGGGGTLGDPGSMMENISKIYQMQVGMQMQRQMLANAPLYAKQLNMPVEQVYALIAQGKLPDILSEVEKNRLTLADPLHQAQIASAQAEVPLKQAQTVSAQAETPLKQAQAATANAEVPLKQAQTTEALAKPALTQAQTAEAQATASKTQQDVAARAKLLASIPNIAKVTGLDPGVLSAMPPDDLAKLTVGAMTPTTGEKDYNLAMSQIPAGAPKPSFDEWSAAQVGLKEAATQSNLLQTQQKMSAQASLPDATAKVQEQLDIADSILKDPALQNLTGYGGTAIGKIFSTLPGSSGAALQAKIDQLAGATGVSAVESLKGVGRILGTEYTAGTEAQSRLHDQTMSAKDYAEAIRDYANKLKTQLNIIRQKAGMPVPSAAPPQAPSAAPLQAPGAAGPTKTWKRNAQGKLELQQ